MKKATEIIWIAAMFIVTSACVEDFEFEGVSFGEGVVVEGYISNQSYNDILAQPFSPRYFTLRLSNVGEVKNTRNQPILGASVELHQDNGVVYDYAEIGGGQYGLFYEDFKVVPGIGYHLEIKLADGIEVLSEIQSVGNEIGMGEFSFLEQKKQQYRNTLGEVSIEEKEGISFFVTTLPNETSEPLYYRWNLDITWVFNAKLAADNSPTKFCWATSKNLFKDYQVLEDYDGGVASELFFLETRSSRLNHGYSALIHQMVMNKGYYTFWNELKKQQNQSELFATPPYNVASNLSSDDIEVYGYFGVVNEEFGRWYFDKDEIDNYGGWVDDHCIVGGPWPAYCFDCQAWTYDDSTVIYGPPSWWNPIYFRSRP